MNPKLKGALGLCIRARKCVMGAQAVTSSIKRRKAKLVLLCESASHTTKDEAIALCNRAGIELKIWELSEMYYDLTGKINLKIIAVEDDSFADMILKIGCL